MAAVALNAVTPARTPFIPRSEFGSVASEIRQHGSPGFRTPCAALVVIGVIGGVLSGLFAIGGAIVMVPLLVWRAGMDQRRATATSLVAILPTAVVSSATYLIHAAVDITAASLVSAGAIAGAIIGSRLLNRLPVAWLRWSFITFLLLTAAHMLVSVPEPPHAQAFWPVVAVGYLLLGILTGVASGLFGIGGAIISVPLLGSIFALSDVVAKGTALLVSIPTSVVGTISNRRGSNPVDVRAGLILGVTAAATSVPAVYAAFALPPKISAVTFAALLIAIAIRLGINKPATDPRPSRYHPDKRSPHMRIDHNDRAVVVIDPQNDVLSPSGKNWDSVGASVTENNTVQHLLEVFSAAKASDLDVFISPHYFYPTDETWLFNGPLELNEFRTNTFARAGALSLDGFIGSGADWLEDFKPFIEDGKTIVASPTKCGARKATISSCNCENAPFPR